MKKYITYKEAVKEANQFASRLLKSNRRQLALGYKVKARTWADCLSQAFKSMYYYNHLVAALSEEQAAHNAVVELMDEQVFDFVNRTTYTY